MPFLWMGETLRPYVPGVDNPLARVEPAAGTARIGPSGGEGGAEARESATAPGAGTPPDADELRRGRAAYAEPAPGAGPRHAAVMAHEIMTRHVVALTPGTTIPEARETARRHGVRHLPVVAEDGRLEGMATDRYLLGAAPGFFAVRDLMARRVLTATPDTEIREIARVMLDEGIGCLPILDARRLLVGIVTTSDILRCLTHPEPIELWA